MSDREAPVYTAEEEAQLTVNLLGATREVHSGVYSGRRLDRSLIQDLHRRLFGDVRGHAGRLRTRGDGSERLVFGPNRSSHRDVVVIQVDELLRRAQFDADALAVAVASDARAEQVLRLALRVHAEIVKIHPFEDGNGRTSRLLMNAVLVRFDLRPLAIEVPKDEYIDALNSFHRTGSLDGLLGVALRCLAFV